ncbi:MAG TPA: ImmA/IrrE family metallo-endopeptidase [Streptosporangiaceae bacterium]|nr:ImmA/IrrE family metallo-endopeptidase [Streptosporangiaceae bacterium]HVB44670.1 ImmA/IrrE family metallo-endopeptidase [Streptosporangiaceae bacterium]
MQWYYGPEGDQRIWYESDEIETIAEDELRRAGLIPSPDHPVTDLERLIEGHLKAQLDQYAKLPDGVLGLTQFDARRRPEVSISSALTEAAEEDPPRPGQIGRWRATLAHEASHIFLHRYLFDPNMAPLPSRQPSDTPADCGAVMRCLHRDVVPVSTQDWGRISRRRDWREVQANRSMAALLMPGRIFKDVAFEQMIQLGLSGLPSSPDLADTLAAAIADVFQVSKQAALIRLGTLRIV